MDKVDLKKEFPTANYDPDPACKRCGGKGYVGYGKTIVISKDGVHIEEDTSRLNPCECIFLGVEIRDIWLDFVKTLRD